MQLDREQILSKLNQHLDQYLSECVVEFEDTMVSEIALVRRVRKGKIVRKVAIKRKGFKVMRKGNTVKFVRMTQKEKRVRRKAARKAWRVGKSARKMKSKRTLRRSKVRIKSLYAGKRK